jgi:hypothetical protein
MAQLCRDEAKRMADTNRRNGWEDLCGDVANIRGLSPLLRRHASDEEIQKYIRNMDTACREMLPKEIWETYCK